MAPHVRLLVGWLVGRSVCHNFLKERKLHFHAPIVIVCSFHFQSTSKMMICHLGRIMLPQYRLLHSCCFFNICSSKKKFLPTYIICLYICIVSCSARANLLQKGAKKDIRLCCKARFKSQAAELT